MIDCIRPLLVQAGAIILGFYTQDVAVSLKSDQSPVTQADITASDFLIKQLKILFPNDEVISEEKLDPVDRKKRVWIIDPLDGTAMFINEVSTFSVIIACIDNGHPIFGAIYYPVTGKLYFAQEHQGCFLEYQGEQNRLYLSETPKNLYAQRLLYKPSALKITETKSLISNHPAYHKTELRPSGFVCTELLSGNYDILLLGGGNKYELGAIEIMIREAGGSLRYFDGSSLDFSQQDVRFEKGIIGKVL